MSAPDDIVAALAVATKKGTAKWFRDDLNEAILCVLPNEIVRLKVQRSREEPSEIEAMWPIVRGVQLLCLPGSNAGQLLQALSADAADDHASLANAKRAMLSEAMKTLNVLNAH